MTPTATSTGAPPTATATPREDVGLGRRLFSLNPTSSRFQLVGVLGLLRRFCCFPRPQSHAQPTASRRGGIAVGGFDESLRAGEDIEFSHRAARAGFPVAYALCEGFLFVATIIFLLVRLDRSSTADR